MIDHHSLDIVHYKGIYDTWDYIEISCDISDIKCDIVHSKDI